MALLDYVVPSFLKGITDESESAKRQREQLEQQGQAAAGFAGQGEQGFSNLGRESTDVRDQLRRYASGQDSVTREMLRQGAQQNYAAQRSMAAGAAPQNQAMAARTAAMQMGRTNAGLSGQMALAGMQERQSATKALSDAIAQQRAMELQAALGSRQTAISGFGGVDPEKSRLEKMLPFINAAIAGGGMIAKGGAG